MKPRRPNSDYSQGKKLQAQMEEEREATPALRGDQGRRKGF